MKKILLTLALIVCFAGSVQADPIDIGSVLDKVELKQGIAYSVVDSGVNSLTTFDLLKKDKYALELGYAGDLDSTDHKVVVVASADLLKLKDYVDVPILDLINLRVGAYIGAGSINTHRIMESEVDYGLSLTGISFKF